MHTYGAHGGDPTYPAIAVVQLPGTALHTAHASAQPLSQQYPSTQCPVAHWRSRLHSCPCPSAPTHTLPWQ